MDLLQEKIFDTEGFIVGLLPWYHGCWYYHAWKKSMDIKNTQTQNNQFEERIVMCNSTDGFIAREDFCKGLIHCGRKYGLLTYLEQGYEKYLNTEQLEERIDMCYGWIHCIVHADTNGYQLTVVFWIPYIFV